MNTRTRIVATGALAGALLGALAAYLYLRSAYADLDSEGREQLPSIHPGKAIAVGLSALTLLRQVVGLGQKG